MTHSAGIAGAEQVLLDIAARLDPSAWKVHLASPEGPLAGRFAELGLDWHRLDLPSIRNAGLFGVVARARRALRHIMTATQASVVIANSNRAAAVVQSLGKHVPTVWYVHDFGLFESNRPGLAERFARSLLARRFRTCVGVSSAISRSLKGAPRTTILNGVDLSKFASVERKPDGQPFAVGVVGRMRPWKGQRDVLKVARELTAEGGAIRFLLAGGTPLGEDGSFEAEIRAGIVNAGLESTVKLLGHVEDIRSLHRRIDVLLHLADPEPGPLAIIEAAAAGIPVIGYAHGSMPELVEDGVTGILVRPGDTAAAAEAVGHLTNSQEVLSRMSEASRERACELFDLRRVAGEFDTMLRSLL